MLGAPFVISGALLAVIVTMGETRGLAAGGLENSDRLLAQNTMGSPNANQAARTEGIIPADRMTVWNPGLNAVGGIPNRTAIYQTLSPPGRLSR